MKLGKKIVYIGHFTSVITILQGKLLVLNASTSQKRGNFQIGFGRLPTTSAHTANLRNFISRIDYFEYQFLLHKENE